MQFMRCMDRANHLWKYSVLENNVPPEVSILTKLVP